MAVKEFCDNCGKQTPDKDGLHVGNNWHELVIAHRKEMNIYTDNRHKILLCDECFDSTGIPKMNWEYYK